MFSGLPYTATRSVLLGFACLALGLAATGCARLNDTAKNMFVSSTPAVAIAGGQLLQGDLQVYADYSGFITLASVPPAAPLQCSGRLPNTSSFGREIDLRCSNGAVAHLRLSLRSDLRGFAYGGEGETATSLALGLDPAESIALLTAPKGMVLSYANGQYSLRAENTPAIAREPALPPAEAAGGVPKGEEPAEKMAPVSAMPLGDQVASKLSEWSQQLRKWMAATGKTESPTTP